MHAGAERLKHALMFEQLILQELIVEAVGLLRIDAVLEHEEIMAVANAGLAVPIVRRIHNGGNRDEGVGLERPEILGDRRGRLQMELSGKFAAIIEGDGGNLDTLAGTAYIRRIEGVNLPVEG